MPPLFDAPASREEVESLLNELDKADDDTKTSVLEPILKKLHAGTRILNDEPLLPLFSKRGVQIISRYAFGEKGGPEHLPALRCLNNMLVRASDTRQIVAHDVGPAKMVATLKRKDPQSELALANILIFCSHNTSLDLTSAFEKDDLAGLINAAVARHVRSGEFPTAEPTSASSAILRLLSTLAAQYESEAHRFADSVDPVLEMLSKTIVLSPPLQPPLSIMLNCLPVLPLSQMDRISDVAIDKLVEVLTDCISFYGSLDKESEFLPLLLTALHITESKDEQAKEQLRKAFIPTDADRTVALGMGNSLSHRLLKLSNASMFPEIRELIMTIFFELSDQNPSRFLYNVGFGNAAGYLSEKGIQLSQSDMQAGNQLALGAEVNPITGQRLDTEGVSELPEMTYAEKEREAERLFVLFERLKATGVIDVENPAGMAMQMRDIEELSDSDDETTLTKTK